MVSRSRGVDSIEDYHLDRHLSSHPRYSRVSLSVEAISRGIRNARLLSLMGSIATRGRSNTTLRIGTSHIFRFLQFAFTRVTRDLQKEPGDRPTIRRGPGSNHGRFDFAAIQ